MSTNPHAIPATWAWARLPEVAENLDHRRVPVNANERSRRLGHVPYYGATGRVGWIDDFLFDEPLVLLGEDGAPFLDPGKPKAYFIEGKSWVNNHAHVLRAMEGGIEVRYLMHVLNNLDYHDAVTGTTRLKLTQAAMNRLAIPLAPLAEQVRIVAVIEKHFTRLDAAVASLQRARANLKRYRASVLKAACEGRLVPTEADLARKEGRGYEPASVLLERILKERRDCWETQERRRGKYKEPQPPDTSNLRPPPEGWMWATLSQIAELQGGITKGQRRGPDEVLRTVPYLRVANVQRGYLDLAEMKTIEATDSEFEQLRLIPGDVLFTEGGDRDKLGRGWIWGGEVPNCIHQNHVFRARSYLPDIEPKLVSWWGNSFGQRFFFRSGKQTTNLASINLTLLSRFPVPLPPSIEQQRIVAEVERHMSVIQAAENVVEANVKRAERLRQAILQRAFQGKLVPQDPSDEPASVLLDRIRAERMQAEAGGPARRRKGGRRSRTQEVSV